MCVARASALRLPLWDTGGRQLQTKSHIPHRHRGRSALLARTRAEGRPDAPQATSKLQDLPPHGHEPQGRTSANDAGLGRHLTADPYRPTTARTPDAHRAHPPSRTLARSRTTVTELRDARARSHTRPGAARRRCRRRRRQRRLLLKAMGTHRRQKRAGGARIYARPGSARVGLGRAHLALSPRSMSETLRMIEMSTAEHKKPQHSPKWGALGLKYPSAPTAGGDTNREEGPGRASRLRDPDEADDILTCGEENEKSERRPPLQSGREH